MLTRPKASRLLAGGDLDGFRSSTSVNQVRVPMDLGPEYMKLFITHDNNHQQLSLLILAQSDVL